jgi:hypothetical protein
MYTVILFAVIGFLIGLYVMLKDDYHRGLVIPDLSVIIPSFFVAFIYAISWAFMGLVFALFMSIASIPRTTEYDLAPLYEKDNRVVWYNVSEDKFLIRYEGEKLVMYNRELPRRDTEVTTVGGKPLFIIEHLHYMHNNWCFPIYADKHRYKICLPDNTP